MHNYFSKCMCVSMENLITAKKNTEHKRWSKTLTEAPQHIPLNSLFKKGDHFLIYITLAEPIHVSEIRTKLFTQPLIKLGHFLVWITYSWMKADNYKITERQSGAQR